MCVRAKSFSSQLCPRDPVQERTMIEQNRVISAPVPRGRQIALPAGDGRQITSHPYAECKNRCHPPFAASQWLLAEEKEGWRSIWWKRDWWDMGVHRPDLKRSTLLPGQFWTETGVMRLQSPPGRCTSSCLMEFLWAPGQEDSNLCARQQTEVMILWLSK